LRILGIHDGHNSSACLFEDGKIIFALQEERIKRQKNYSGFPKETVKYLFQKYDLSPEKIDGVVFNGKHMPPAKSGEEFKQEYKKSGSLLTSFKVALKNTKIDEFYIQKRREQRIKDALELGFKPSQLDFIDHHLCHAASAYYGWGKYDEDILVLTNDGAGDRICATVNLGRKGKLERIAQVPESVSIAALYAYVTFYCGMTPLEHEYKLMGLAPYADKKLSQQVFESLRQYYYFDPQNPLVWKTQKGIPHAFQLYEFLKGEFELVRFDGIMGGLQELIEDMLVQWVKNAIKQTGIKKVALSGGIFLNVKANQKIMELEEVEELFIFPSCGDETNTIGACYQKYAQEADFKDIQPLREFYLGPEFTEAEIKEAIDKSKVSKLEVKKIEEIESKIAELLAQGEIVARFKGREEFGARALGNRSILANPRDAKVIRPINEMIKNRDFWMPFAASILEEAQDKYLVNPKKIPAPYMILSFPTTEKREDIQAGIHPYDFTCRPQIVSKDENPGYWNLINAFKKLTGVGAILNTSFNLHGYPIVHSPKDALEVFAKSGLKFLAIGDYLLAKKRVPK